VIKKVSGLLLALGLTAGLVFGVQYIPIFTISVGATPAEHTIDVKAKELTLVCPGAAFKSGGKSGTKVGAFERIDTAAIDYTSNLPAGVNLTKLPLTGAGASATAISDSNHALANVGATTAVALRVSDPMGTAVQGSSLLTAQNYQVVSDPAMQGAVGANCQSPTVEQWFIGATTTIGRESLLLISNPNNTDATVDLNLFGANGSIDSAGLNGIAVSANRSVVLPLAGFAPENESLTVHLTAHGAAVASWIQQKTVRGTSAAGADLISPSTDASKDLVIPGLLKRGTADATKLIAGNDNYSDLTPRLSIFVPGDVAATVTAQIIGLDAKTYGTVVQETVSGKQSQEFPITGLKDGDYAVFITSSQPVIAGIKLSRTKSGKTPNTDFTYLPAVASSETTQVIAVPNSGISKLCIAATADSSAQVEIVDLGTGEKSTVTVPKLASRVISLKAGSVVSVSATGAASSTLVVDFDSQIVAIPMVDFRNVGGKLSVLVR
jgi:hypothetical protein